MFERFSRSARQVVVVARDEAQRMRHPAIGTEHLLLGILGSAPNIAARALDERGISATAVRRRILDIVGDSLDPDALATLGIDLDEVRRAAEASFGPGALDPASRQPRGPAHVPMTNRGKKVLQLALREAIQLRHKEITTAHILLGLIREEHGIAAKVLTEAESDLAGLRTAVIRLSEADAA